MKFISYIYNDDEHYGLLDNDKIFPLKSILSKESLDTPKNLLSFICSFKENDLELISKLRKTYSDYYINLKEVKVLAPISYPDRNLFCLGKNYIDHAKEIVGLPGSDDNIPKFPIYFTKSAYPAIGHNDSIKNHKDITSMIDYEVELGIIIGKDGINISKEDAYDYIFGYTIVNDVSARNLQRKHNQWFKGKSLETFCPMGPVILHKSAISYPVKLDIKCFVNDEIRQNSNTSNMIFDIDHIISDLSKGMKLKAGDIIITGTPSGVGLGFTPFKFLKSKDKIDCYIENIGTLTNYIE